MIIIEQNVPNSHTIKYIYKKKIPSLFIIKGYDIVYLHLKISTTTEQNVPNSRTIKYIYIYIYKKSLAYSLHLLHLKGHDTITFTFKNIYCFLNSFQIRFKTPNLLPFSLWTGENNKISELTRNDHSVITVFQPLSV